MIHSKSVLSHHEIFTFPLTLRIVYNESFGKLRYITNLKLEVFAESVISLYIPTQWRRGWSTGMAKERNLLKLKCFDLQFHSI